MQTQCNFNITSFGLFFVCLFCCFKKCHMSADISNSVVFCVSTEAVGPQQLKRH